MTLRYKPPAASDLAMEQWRRAGSPGYRPEAQQYTWEQLHSLPEARRRDAQGNIGADFSGSSVYRDWQDRANRNSAAERASFDAWYRNAPSSGPQSFRPGLPPAQGSPNSDMAAWSTPEAAREALGGRPVVQFGPGSYGGQGGEPMGPRPQQPQGGVYGQSPFSPLMTQPGSSQQQSNQFGQPFNYLGWLQQGRPDSGQAAWQAAGSPKSRPQGGAGEETVPYNWNRDTNNYYGLGSREAWKAAGSPKSFRPGQAQPIEPAFGGTPYGAPSPWGDVFQRPPPAPGYGADGYGGGAQPSQRPGFPDRDRDGIDDRQQSSPADFKQPDGVTAAVMKRAPTGKTWAEYSSQFPSWAAHEAKQKADQEARQKRSQELAERVRYMNDQAAATSQARGIPYNPPAATGSPPAQQGSWTDLMRQYETLSSTPRDGEKAPRGRDAAFQETFSDASSSGAYRPDQLETFKNRYEQNLQADRLRAARMSQAQQPAAAPASPPRFSDYFRGDGSYDYAAATEAGKAYQRARVNSPENQKWLKSQTPANRRVYSLLQNLY